MDVVRKIHDSYTGELNRPTFFGISPNIEAPNQTSAESPARLSIQALTPTLAAKSVSRA